MRTSAVMTISLPQAMVKESARMAKRQGMTRSELIRTALRRFFEEQDHLEAVRVYEKERREGKLKTLTSLADLMK